MTRYEIIVALDQEIQRLETARTLIHNSRDVAAGIAVKNGYEKPAVRRHISPEGRKRIIEAQRRRWAKQKKEDAKGK
jgi:transcriptional regulator GlxA family with amidase domain